MFDVFTLDIKWDESDTQMKERHCLDTWESFHCRPHPGVNSGVQKEGLQPKHISKVNTENKHRGMMQTLRCIDIMLETNTESTSSWKWQSRDAQA